MLIDNLEIEIKSWNNAYSFSSEEDGKKRIYTIYSPKLKQKLKEIISPYAVPNRISMEYKGKNSFGDRILYQPGKGDLPDQLTLISREIIDQQEIDEEREQEKERVEWKQEEEEWEKRKVELGIPSNSVIKSRWQGKDKEGNVTYKGVYFKSETESYIITIENKKDNTPQIQQITDEKVEQKVKEDSKNLVKHEEKKDNKEAVFTPRHQIPPKK